MTLKLAAFAFLVISASGLGIFGQKTGASFAQEAPTDTDVQVRDKHHVENDNSGLVVYKLDALNAFTEFCVGTDLDFSKAIGSVSARNWTKIPNSKLDDLLWGILPHDRLGYRNPESDIILVFELQGEVTPESRRLFEAGVRSESLPVSKENLLPDPFGLIESDAIGTKSCRVIAVGKSQTDILADFRSLDFHGIQLESPHAYSRQRRGAVSGQRQRVLTWPLPTGEMVNFTWDTPYGEEGVIEMSIGSLVELSDPQSSYELDPQ